MVKIPLTFLYNEENRKNNKRKHRPIYIGPLRWGRHVAPSFFCCITEWTNIGQTSFFLVLLFLLPLLILIKLPVWYPHCCQTSMLWHLSNHHMLHEGHLLDPIQQCLAHQSKTQIVELHWSGQINSFKAGVRQIRGRLEMIQNIIITWISILPLADGGFCIVFWSWMSAMGFCWTLCSHNLGCAPMFFGLWLHLEKQVL